MPMTLWEYAVHRARTALRAVPPPRPTTWENLMREDYKTLTGVCVDEYSALDYSPIWSGVSTLSRDIAKLPLFLYKNTSDGGKVLFKDHPLYRILHDDPNPEMTSFKFRETMQALCILWGNSYAEIVRDAGRRIAGLYPIVPYRVAPYREQGSGLLRYRVQQPSGGQKVLNPEDIIHLSSLSLDGIIGESLTGHARASIALGLATQRFGESFFGNGATFGGVVEYPQALNEKTKEDIRTLIEAVHQGVDRAHKILVAAGGAKFTQRGTPPNEAQFIETRKFQINETARWLSMPPHKLGDLENAHFTNIEEQELQYYVGCVSGWLEMWEQELSRKLISRLEYAQQTIEHNLEGVLRGDSTKRADFYGKMHGMGVFSINDILRKENMNPIGEDGDKHLVPLNMIPIERYDEYIDAKVITPTATQPAQTPPDQTDLQQTQQAQRHQEIVAAIRESQAKLEAVRDLSVTTGETVTRKLDQEITEHATAAQAARQAQAEAEARAEADRAAREQAEAALVAAKDELRQARESAARAEQAVTEHAARVALATTTVESTEVRARQAAERADASDAEKATALAAAEDAKRLLTEREQALAQARQDTGTAATTVERVEAALRAETDARTAAESAVRLQRQAALTRRTGMVSAHRELIIDAVRRIARTETERARKRSATPETLRRWIDAFYDEDGREVCTDILCAAIRVHLAWMGAAEDPRAAARRIADAYCDDSASQLRTLTDGMDGDEFQAAIVKLLNRWEHDRPGVVADALLTEEIDHLARGAA